MATVIASIARGETRTKPTLQALSREDAMQVNHGGESIGLTPEQTRLLWEGMERVVGPDGTGRLVQIDDFRIAGKTGTADFRAHGKEVNLAWFIGFAPVENPQIAVAVMVEGTTRATPTTAAPPPAPWPKTSSSSSSRNTPSAPAFRPHASGTREETTERFPPADAPIHGGHCSASAAAPTAPTNTLFPTAWCLRALNPVCGMGESYARPWPLRPAADPLKPCSHQGTKTRSTDSVC